MARLLMIPIGVRAVTFFFVGAFHPLFLTADAIASLAFFYFWIGVGYA